MQPVTVQVPVIGTEALFAFKDPFNTYIANTFLIDLASVKFKVSSVISMPDMIRVDLRDPFTLIYAPVGLNEVSYKEDLKDNVPIITLSFVDRNEVERYTRVPLNYIASYAISNEIHYINTLLVADLGALPERFDSSAVLEDLKEFIHDRLGVNAQVRQISIGQYTAITEAEHQAREAIRSNEATVRETYRSRYEKAAFELEQLHLRLNALGIALGE